MCYYENLILDGKNDYIESSAGSFPIGLRPKNACQSIAII
jgi:hypothetical protein